MFFFAFCSFETNYLIPVLFSRAQANAGPQRQKGAQTTRLASFGPLYVRMFFFAFCSKLTILYKFYLATGTAGAGQRRPTKAHSSQRRPTKANAGPHGWALRMFFFRVLFQTNYLIQVLFSSRHSERRPTQADEGPQQPMTANEGQRRPTKTKRGPNDASGVVWAIICSYVFFRVLFQTNYLIQILFSSRHSGRRPTQADEGPQQPTTANEGQCRPTRLGLTYVFFPRFV